MPASDSPALPVAYVALRILIILNWVMGLAILVLLTVMPNREWIMSAFELSPSPDTERLILGLRTIAWALLALQILSLVIAAIAKSVSTPDHPVELDAGFSVTGWLAILLIFVLARVFAEGARMREELEGTV